MNFSHLFQHVETERGLIFSVTEQEWDNIQTGDKIKLKDLDEEENIRVDKESIDFATGWLVGSTKGDGSKIDTGDKFIKLEYHYSDNGNSNSLEQAQKIKEICRGYISKVFHDIGKIPDGSHNKKDKVFYFQLYGKKYARLSPYFSDCGKNMSKKFDEKAEESFSFKAGFISGMFDADGCVPFHKIEKKTVCVILAQSDYPLLLKVAYMLLEFGIMCSIYRVSEGGKKEIQGKMCQTKPGYHLSIGKYSNLQKFKKYIGFREERKDNQLASFLERQSKQSRIVQEDFLDSILEKSENREVVYKHFNAYAQNLSVTSYSTSKYNLRPKRKFNTGYKEVNGIVFGKNYMKRRL